MTLRMPSSIRLGRIFQKSTITLDVTSIGNQFQTLQSKIGSDPFSPKPLDNTSTTSKHNQQLMQLFVINMGLFHGSFVQLMRNNTPAASIETTCLVPTCCLLAFVRHLRSNWMERVHFQERAVDWTKGGYHQHFMK